MQRKKLINRMGDGAWVDRKYSQSILCVPGGAPRRYDTSATRPFHASADRLGTDCRGGEVWVLLADGRLSRMFWENLRLICFVVRAA